MQNALTQISFIIGGFAYHVTRIHGNVYRDHRNDIWILKNDRFHSECGGIVSGPVETKQKGWISADDMFLQDRENWASFFNNRYYKNL